MPRRVLGFVIGLFLLRAAIEDLIDGLFPNSGLRIALGLVLVVFFGYHLLKDWRKL